MTPVDPARWTELRPLLDEILELDEAGRQARLKEISTERPELVSELSALVTASDHPPSILDGPLAIRSVSGQELPTIDRNTGQRCGAYRLLRPIGIGGMALVYLAERADGAFDHAVAVKLMRPGLDTEAIRQRLRAEQQFQAALNHPNIARLHDGGLTDDLAPFIVMEYVDGLPLTDYCDHHQLPISERLELFGTVCEAVQYAHSKLIVHRDLKPSNILVTAEGVVKLLDFGIAKLVEPGPGGVRDKGTLTELYGTPMTPEYAAPEQIAGELVTTSADVYSLGVVLYELLTAQRPHSFASLDAHRVAEAFLGAEPERPSSRVRRQLNLDHEASGPSAAELARRRGTSVTMWPHRLVGDLDNIVLKALRVEPERRYLSVAQLREDLQRYQTHLPVLARPSSWSYVASRFVRRHRLAIALSTMVLVALIAGFGLALWGRQVARQEARTSDRISHFLVELFRAPDPTYGRDGSLTATELLEEGARRIQSELAGEPEIRAAMMLVIGDSFAAVGAYDRAAALVHSGLELRQELLGPYDREVLEATHQLAVIYRDMGRLDEATDLFGKLLTDIVRQNMDSELEASVLNDHGMILREQGHPAEAESAYRRALSIRHRDGSTNTQQGARTLNNLAMAVREQGRLEDAEILLGEVLAVQREVLSEPHVDIATTLNNLAAVIRRRGDYDQAETLYREALGQRRAIYGDSHPDVAQSLNNMGTILYYKGDLDGAAEWFERALAVWQQFFAGDHPRLADGLSNLGSIRQRQGFFARAEDAFSRAAAMQERLHGPRAEPVARALLRWGASRIEAADLPGALPLLERSARLRSDLHGARDERTLEAKVELAACLQGLGQAAKARKILESVGNAAGDNAKLLERIHELTELSSTTY